MQRNKVYRLGVLSWGGITAHLPVQILSNEEVLLRKLPQHLSLMALTIAI